MIDILVKMADFDLLLTYFKDKCLRAPQVTLLMSLFNKATELLMSKIVENFKVLPANNSDNDEKLPRRPLMYIKNNNDQVLRLVGLLSRQEHKIYINCLVLLSKICHLGDSRVDFFTFPNMPRVSSLCNKPL